MVLLEINPSKAFAWRIGRLFCAKATGKRYIGYRRLASRFHWRLK